MRAHCQACEDKEAELAYLRSELALINDIESVRRIRLSLNLSGMTEARMLLHFTRCRHHTATRLQLADLLDNEVTETKCVDVFLSRIRTRVGSDVFESIWGHGWRMTPVWVQRLREIIETEPGQQRAA